MQKTVTIKQAYEIMLVFLERLYEQTKSDDLGGLLGGFSLLPDGHTADPAAWEDWLDAARVVLKKTAHPGDAYSPYLQIQ